MSDWELPEHIEPFPDNSAELRAALAQLNEAAKGAAEASRAMAVAMTLMGLDLVEWDAEMDNCYPGFD